jgi:hypothetical protein
MQITPNRPIATKEEAPADSCGSLISYASGLAEVPPQIHACVGWLAAGRATFAPETFGGGHRGGGDAQGGAVIVPEKGSVVSRLNPPEGGSDRCRSCVDFAL